MYKGIFGLTGKVLSTEEGEEDLSAEGKAEVRGCCREQAWDG